MGIITIAEKQMKRQIINMEFQENRWTEKDEEYFQTFKSRFVRLSQVGEGHFSSVYDCIDMENPKEKLVMKETKNEQLHNTEVEILYKLRDLKCSEKYFPKIVAEIIIYGTGFIVMTKFGLDLYKTQIDLSGKNVLTLGMHILKMLE